MAMCFTTLANLSKSSGGLTFAPLINFRAGGANGGDHLVAGSKIVTLRFFRISPPMGKNDAGISPLHHSGALRFVGNEPGEFSIGENELGIDFCGTHGIVGPNLIDAEAFVLFDELGKARHHRAGKTIQPLKRSNFSDHLARLDIQGSYSRMGCVLGESGSHEDQEAD